MAGIFARIASGEIPCHKVAETDQFLAFLDINPLKAGHTLVIPKQEIDYLFDLSDDTYAGLALFAKKVAIALKNAVPCKRVSVVVLGFEVPHAHIHLIPSNSEHDANFSNSKLKPDADQLKETAKKIAGEFLKLS